MITSERLKRDKKILADIRARVDPNKLTRKYGLTLVRIRQIIAANKAVRANGHRRVKRKTKRGAKRR